MAYDARVFQILIASPGDVPEERDIVTEVVHEWNQVNSRERSIVLLPLRWETHSTPELNERPQSVINRQVVDHCDMAVGVFWTRMGTRTDVAESGTAEEIQRVGESGKPVMLYFSRAKVDLEEVDLAEYARLAAFKEKTYPQGLVVKYETPADFREKFAHHLALKVRELVAADTDTETVEPQPGHQHTGLQLRLAEGDPPTPLPENVVIEVERIVCVDVDDIPDYYPSEQLSASPDGVINVVSSETSNRNYYRDVVRFHLERDAYRPFRLALVNNEVQGLQQLLLELVVTSSTGDPQLLTDNPPIAGYTRSTGTSVSNFLADKGTGTTIQAGSISTVNFYSPQDQIRLREDSPGSWRMELEVSVVYATRPVFSRNEFWINVTKPAVVSLDCTAYSPNSAPFAMRTDVQIKVSHREMTYREILSEYQARPPV